MPLKKGKRIVLTTVVIVVTSWALWPSDHTTLEIRDVAISGMKVHLTASIQNARAGVEWTGVPSIQAVLASERETVVETQRGIYAVTINSDGTESKAGHTILDASWFQYQPISAERLNRFEDTVFFPDDWDGGEVVFAVRYRKANRWAANWLRAHFGGTPVLGRFVASHLARVEYGKVIYSNPVSIPKLEQPSEGSLMMQGFDGL